MIKVSVTQDGQPAFEFIPTAWAAFADEKGTTLKATTVADDMGDEEDAGVIHADGLREALTRATEDLLDVQKMRDAALAQVSRMSQDRLEAERKVERVQAEWKRATTEANQLGARVNELGDYIARIESESKQAHKENDRLVGEMRLAKDTINRLSEELARTKKAPAALFVALDCRGCGKLLLPQNQGLADGCPCNSRRGVNHGIVLKSVCTCTECDPLQCGSSRFGLMSTTIPYRSESGGVERTPAMPVERVPGIRSPEQLRAALITVLDAAVTPGKVLSLPVPARPSMDPDIILSDAINEIVELRERVARLDELRASAVTQSESQLQRALRAERIVEQCGRREKDLEKALLRLVEAKNDTTEQHNALVEAGKVLG